MYARMDSDKVARTLEELAPPLPPKGIKERFLFTVKIVHAENLPPTDSSSKLDTFVTLSDEKGVRLAKTRTIYESLAPRCALLILRV
jgi:3-polyprenyl-4-hydroxybenzoate decarboxylase